STQQLRTLGAALSLLPTPRQLAERQKTGPGQSTRQRAALLESPTIHSPYLEQWYSQPTRPVNRAGAWERQDKERKSLLLELQELTPLVSSCSRFLSYVEQPLEGAHDRSPPTRLCRR
uniref:Uncharacterized protein n=1 Tax=Gopherus evgoodei TaxID=1825980 RepID=A0A8C4VX07_9SAUR